MLLTIFSRKPAVISCPAILLSSLLICLSFGASAQTTGGGCTGNLGENLFAEGDFGSGIENIPQEDPGIAPGYTYRTVGPPNDGFYTITNNTGAWQNLYGTWIRIRDNSSDPNGYMMVVNASFEPGIFYQQQISGLCANTTFEFSADVINVVGRNVANHIKPDISFFINDSLYFSSGPIPQDETWKTYGFTFTTGPDDETLVLSIRNNAPGGTGNDLALDNISFRPCGPLSLILPEEETFVCIDEDSLRLGTQVFNADVEEPAFQWQVSSDGGLNYTDIPGATANTYTVTNFASGTYHYRYLVAGTAENLSNVKCRVFSQEKLVTVVPKFFSVTDTLCEGLTYDAGHQTYDRSGVYVDTLVSSLGCDSIVTLDLTILTDPGIRASLLVEDPTCFGQDNGRITLSNPRLGGPPYTYHLNGESSPSGVFELLGPGEYQIEMTDRYGCRFEEQLELFYPEELIVDLGPDTLIPLGQSYQFDPFSNYANVQYQWDAPVELECPLCPQPSVRPLERGTYLVTVTNASGCMATDSLVLGIDRSRSYRIFAPNIFSPNGDGINDRFYLFSNGIEVEIIEVFRIFDRWGTMLYEIRSIPPDERDVGWDGRYRGQLLDTGVYIYQAEVLFIDGTRQTFTGTTTILR